MGKAVKTLLALLSTFLCIMPAWGQEFGDHFLDKTLRLDYILAGNAKEQHIYLEEMMCQDGWAGRKNRLSEKFLNGNGQLTVCDHSTQEVIYVWTFSTLFQEWLQYDEAKSVDKAFEASYNIPFPKSAIDVTISLTDNHQRETARMTHTVDPSDILIRRISGNGIPFHYVWKGKPHSPTLHPDENDSRKDTYRKRDYTYIDYNPLEGVNLTDCVDLAIVAEGYTKNQMGKFYADCERAVDALFAWEPFKSLKDRFNVVAVAAPSEDAGPSVPHDGIWKRGTSGAHYDTFYSDRYLMSQNMHKIYDLLSGVPFEHIMVLVNSNTYGGGGIYNQVTFATSDHPTFKQIFVHEFGHSYAGLADEYAYDDMDEEWYPADTEPWEPNITTLKDFGSKWADMMPKKTAIPTPLDSNVPDFKLIEKNDIRQMARLNACTQVVGVFEGAGYQSKGCYRPAQECRMKINEVEDFCPVCARAIRRITDFYTAK